MWQTINPKSFSPSIFKIDGISEKTIRNHLKLYDGYVSKTNEVMEKLNTVDRSTANQTYSELRSLKTELSFAVGGVKNHEIYFAHLGGKGGQPKGKMMDIINKHFGSYDKWLADFKATGMAARGWVWLAYDWRFKTWQNYLGDAHNTYPVWEGAVAIALDTYEHAYFADFGTDRAGYIDVFMNNLDWGVVEASVKGWNI